MTLTELHTKIGDLMRETGRGSSEIIVQSPDGVYLTVEGVQEMASGFFYIDTEKYGNE